MKFDAAETMIFAGIAINLCGLFASCSSLIELNLSSENQKIESRRDAKIERIITDICSHLNQK